MSVSTLFWHSSHKGDELMHISSRIFAIRMQLYTHKKKSKGNVFGNQLQSRLLFFLKAQQQRKKNQKAYIPM